MAIPPSPPSPQRITEVTPQRPPLFILHKDYFYLRQREHKKKQQQAEATETLKHLDLPPVPNSSPPLLKAQINF